MQMYCLCTIILFINTIHKNYTCVLFSYVFLLWLEFPLDSLYIPNARYQSMKLGCLILPTSYNAIDMVPSPLTHTEIKYLFTTFVSC